MSKTNDPFRALADENRRALLDRLHLRDGQTLAELCEELDMSRQAVSKHLGILEGASLVTCIMDGRNKLHFLNPVPLQQIADRWLSKFQRHRAASLTALKARVEAKQNERSKKNE